jgi:hypothetical protein
MRAQWRAVLLKTNSNTEAPQYAFLKAGRNLSVRCGATNDTKSWGGNRATSRWSAPGPGKRTRREKHAPPIVHDEFRTGYSLIGLLASRARLRFTGVVRISLDGTSRNELSSNGNGVLSSVSHRRGPPHYRRSSAFIGSRFCSGYGSFVGQAVSPAYRQSCRYTGRRPESGH